MLTKAPSLAKGGYSPMTSAFYDGAGFTVTAIVVA